MSNLYALLIGVDFYFEHVLPDGIYFPSLGGCVRDIRHVEAYLTDPARLNLPQAHVLTLTATNTHSGAPAEPPEEWPTYANIVHKFQALTEMVQAGDQVYIQYSGHGGRATTIYPDLKGDTGVDECLVPPDIGDANARYLRDIELHYLIGELVKKQVQLTVVLDCCHSGGATRGQGGARKRGLSTIDTTARPTDSLVASPTALAASWQQGSNGQTRATKPASGWLLEPRGYTLLAACRASESAFEYPFNGTESNGALTYWLLDTLRQSGQNIRYQTLHNRIVAKVHGQFAQQTPMLQGEGNRHFFGSDSTGNGDSDENNAVYTVPVLQVDAASQRVRLNAGEVHGITPGAQFALYPHDTTDFDNTANRLALVEVTHANETDAWATILTQGSNGTLDVGAQALLIHSANLRTQREVTVAIDDPTRKAQVEAVINAQGKGFVTVATGDKSDFQVAVNETANEQQAYEIWDAAGAPVPNLRPSIAVGAADAEARLVARLVHLAKYANVRELAAPAANVAQKLHVSLVPLTANPARDAGGAPIYQPGDKIKLVVRNDQPPGEKNDPARILNITILNLAPDWSITQIYPAGAAAFEPLDPGGTLEFEFEAYLGNGRTEALDILKVFATQGTTNFRWLQLPALDQPPAPDAIQRAAIGDPLEQLLASLTGETLTTRDLRITSSPQTRAWTTAQVELRVQSA